MARSTQEIYNQIIAKIEAEKKLYDPTNPDPLKRGLTSKSKVALFRLYAWTVAIAHNLLEQLMDIFKTEIETTVSKAAPGTPAWIQKQVFLFQYSDTTPQILQLDPDTMSTYYPTPNEALRIVTQCSVVTLPNKVVSIKVAKGGTSPAALTTTEKTTLAGFLDFINFAGVSFALISTDADFILLGADVYFAGQYAATIEANVKKAITDYLANLNSENFNYLVYLARLEDTIQAVPGVKDVVLKQVECRPAAVAAASATVLVDNYKVLLSKYRPYAGYMIVDTDAGRGLDDTLNFIVSND